ncbi:conserved protein of unknown function [Limnospira indica PCC 8005]|uniref:HNH endonuclease n=1 Tax=Limnospira indica PCC 8005 TaxID=376219 RepID=A0A9P1KGD1_9CYAN|nr:conserved protein of unknown function [Limnospira indica PCC 8005]
MQGFQTGDMVKTVAGAGKKIRTYLGSVGIRSSGSFNVTTARGWCKASATNTVQLYKKDGYAYGY